MLFGFLQTVVFLDGICKKIFVLYTYILSYCFPYGHIWLHQGNHLCAIFIFLDFHPFLQQAFGCFWEFTFSSILILAVSMASLFLSQLVFCIWYEYILFLITLPRRWIYCLVPPRIHVCFLIDFSFNEKLSDKRIHLKFSI